MTGLRAKLPAAHWAALLRNPHYDFSMVERRRLSDALLALAECRTCLGRGTVPEFFLGTIKKCPACDGSGTR